ncbi:MAG: hypothetical protein PWQ54_691 [Bacteroidales bacterium]|nr:hypothetical protein [Bacteroidales bacterium]
MVLNMLSTKNFWWTTVLTGLFTGLLVFTLYFLLLLLSHNIYSWIFVLVYILPFIGMTYATLRFKNRFNDGYISFNEAFITAYFTGIVAAIIYALLIYFVYTQMNSNELKYRSLQIEQYLQMQAGNLSLTEISTLRKQINKLLSASYLSIYNLIFHSVLYVIYAVLIAIFVRRKNRFIEA